MKKASQDISLPRRSFLKKAGVGLAAGAGIAAGMGIAAPKVHAQPTLRWRLVSSFPKSLDTLIGPSEAFAKIVGAMSGGKFTITVHPAGEIVPAFGVLDAAQNGTVECAHTAPYYFFGKDDTFALGTAIPFGLNSRQMQSWLFAGNGLTLFREFYKSYNIINFPMGNTGAQMGGWYRKEIKSLADMKGLKMRTAGIAGKVQERLGAVTVSTPGGEVYTALEKGTIDAAEFVGPYDDLKLGLYKVAPHYYYPGWWEGSAQTDLYVNIKAYEALPAEYKAMIEAAATRSQVLMHAQYDARNPIALKQLVAAGAKLHRFPKDVMNAAFKESNALYAEISAKNPRWKKIYDDYIKFRAEQNMWFRFAEAGFDDFMQAQKL
ncbi:MAG: ABC transporter substrate-binding protein [Deltaproteobacteria bacterium HGW-Deltaproteobacteria-12]|jgi:TRAP-type mannitol/chloroaromatic compound transport system substrate-binding protein|nr:MAG: ABC transporter substrate-binding protein [Deltaproteobacteria bacterium HGW-Deltaproteobacteria-12]